MKNKNQQPERKRPRVQKHFTQPSLTKSEFKDDCDINLILQKWMKTGVAPTVAASKPVYLDLTLIPDARATADTMATLHNEFSLLPANIRKRFNFDAMQLVDFLSDIDTNRDEAIRLGLLPADEPNIAPAGAGSAGDPSGDSKKPSQELDPAPKL